MRLPVVVAVLVVVLLAARASAEARLLDGDAPTQVVAVVKPGDVLVLGMKYDVTFSSLHGDDENTDSEFFLANIRVRVGLGDDNVKLWVWKDGEEVFEYTITRQSGFVANQHVSGSVVVRVDVSCDGLVSVIFNGRTVATTMISGSANLVGDNDVVLINKGSHSCGSSGSGNSDDITWEKHGKAPVSLVLGAGAVGTAAVAALALRRW